MTKPKNYSSKKVGLPPGTLVHVGRRKEEFPKITLIQFDSENIEKLKFDNIEDCLEKFKKGTTKWLNIDGLHDIELIAKIGKEFDLHPLILEDILNTNHRPVVDIYDNNIFFSLKMLEVSRKGKYIISEQISIVALNGLIISFQEKEDNVFDKLRNGLQENKTGIRSKGSDFIFYRLIDNIVDNYFYVTEFIGNETEKLEEKILNNQTPEYLIEIQKLKKQLAKFHKAISPLRKASSVLQNYSGDLISEKTARYFSDVYEHIQNAYETGEFQREEIYNLIDLHFNGVSFRTNQVMKVLTIISTIFIPLTFIAGIYGMNFDLMPGIHWKYGFFVLWIVLVIIVAFMIRFFKKRKWI
jgi:magnesium transporter